MEHEGWEYDWTFIEDTAVIAEPLHVLFEERACWHLLVLRLTLYIYRLAYALTQQWPEFVIDSSPIKVHTAAEGKDENMARRLRHLDVVCDL